MATFTWVGGQAGNDWSSPLNWSGGSGVPGIDDTALITTSGDVTLTVSGTVDAINTILSDGPDSTTLDVVGTLTVGALIDASTGAFALVGPGEVVATGNLSISAASISLAGLTGKLAVTGILSVHTGTVTLSGVATSVNGTTELTGGTTTISPTEPVGIATTNALTATGGVIAGPYVAADAPCFAADTLIATDRGEVRVQDLQVGELVRTPVRGGSAAVRWIGRRTVDLRHCPRPADMRPVRIHAHAFGPEQPRRDLILSPDHAVLCNGVLIPVRYLINGATIVQEAWQRVTWFHVELDRHDILPAEGLMAESYLDTGNRSAFINGGPTVSLHPDFSPTDAARKIWHTRSCAKLVTEGPDLAATRQRLLDQAEVLGHARTEDPDLAILADGVTIAVRRAGNVWRATLPAGTRMVRLRSRSAVPAEIRVSDTDHRRLGIAVRDLRLDGRPVQASAQKSGWHKAETGWQWTDGDALFAAGGGRDVTVQTVMSLHYWHRPLHPFASSNALSPTSRRSGVGGQPGMTRSTGNAASAPPATA